MIPSAPTTPVHWVEVFRVKAPNDSDGNGDEKLPAACE